MPDPSLPAPSRPEDPSTALIEHQLQAAVARIEALEAELAAQRAAPFVSADVGPAEVGPVGRRRFLNTAAAVVGGAVAGGVAAVAGTPGIAAAADTDAILAGSVNQATTRTVLQTSGDLEYGFGVHEVGLASFGNHSPALAGHAEDHYRTAVLGLARGTSTIGFRALVPSTNGVGLVADASGAGASGVVVNATAPYTSLLGACGIRVVANQAPGAVVVGDRPVVLRPAVLVTPPPDRAIAYDSGTLAVSSDGSREQLSVWLCTNSGTPGTWRKLAGADSAGAFHVLPSTIRVYDSRPGKAPLGVVKGPLGSAQTRTVDATLGGAVPVGATAALVNLTIVDTSATGFLALHRNGIAWPGNSTINWSAAGTVLANSAVVALDAQARLAVKCSTDSSTHFVIDVVGYYR